MTLIAYWPLDEDSGSTAYDEKGNYDGGINDGGDSTVPGASGLFGQSSYSFDGNNDYVDISDSSVISPSKITISAWINPDDVSATSGEMQYTIVSLSATTGNNDGLLFGIDRDGNKVIEASSWVELTGNKTLTTGEWYHVVFTHDGQSSKLYVNGKLDAYTSKSGDITYDGNRSDSIGVWEPGFDNNSNWFDGRISELRIYNHALTQQEVRYLYSVSERGLHTSSSRTL